MLYCKLWGFSSIIDDKIHDIIKTAGGPQIVQINYLLLTKFSEKLIPSFLLLDLDSEENFLKRT